MAEKDGTFERLLDRLYGLPLDGFTSEREAAARELRRAGRREAADELRKLRKPSRVAWAINQVQRAHPESVHELIAAGARLREAQRQLVEAGERGQLRSAAADERDLVARIAQLAQQVLSAAGHAADATTEARLFSTLHAAAASEEVADQLARGRLLRDHEISDLGLAAGGAPAAGEAETPARSRTAGRAKQADPAQATRRKERQRRERTLRRRLEEARERRLRLEEKSREAQRRAAAAEGEAAKAAAAAERGRRAATDAEAAAREAASRMAAIEAELGALLGE